VSDPVGEFRTHRNYTRAFAVICGHIHGRTPLGIWRDMLPKVLRSPGLETKPQGHVLSESLRKSLANAWGTEYLLSVTYRFAREDELIRITNTWAVVQAYYVHYHAFRALLAARGFDPPARHDQTQSMFADYWAGRRQDSPPCSLGVGVDGPVNVPPTIELDGSVHPWSRCDDTTSWSVASLALRTTREESVSERKRANREKKRRERRREWLREEEDRLRQGRRARKEPSWPLPRLAGEEQQRIERSVRVHTVMDYLYRLRVKANYLDSTVFLEGPEDEETSRRLLQDLKDLAADALFLHELHVMVLLGKPSFIQLAGRWLEGVSGGPKLGLAAREDLFRQAEL
jgi:hypothetical protein